MTTCSCWRPIPSGGSLAGWLDTPSSPSLATIVANIGGRDASRRLGDLDGVGHDAPQRLRDPIHRRSVARTPRPPSDRGGEPWSSSPRSPRAVSMVLADIGRRHPGDVAPALVGVGRDDTGRAPPACSVGRGRSGAARTARRIGRAPRRDRARQLTLAVVGADPFDPAEIAEHVDASVPGSARRCGHARGRSTRGGRARRPRRRVGQSPATPPAHALGSERCGPPRDRIAIGYHQPTERRREL